MGLTRFGGHPETFTRGAADAEIPTTVFALARLIHGLSVQGVLGRWTQFPDAVLLTTSDHIWRALGVGRTGRVRGSCPRRHGSAGRR